MTGTISSESGDPQVSVIMPAYRTPEFIGEAITSVLQQSFTDFELFVVDDNSGDETLCAARMAAGNDTRVEIIELTENVGAGAARNVAIDRARGRYIAFLDSDDIWYPEKLAVQLNFMEKHAAPLTFGRYDYIDENSNKTATLPAPKSMTHAQLLRCCPIGCLTAMYDRKLVGTVKMPTLRRRQDWATWLRILKGGGVGLGIDTALGAYRHRSGSLSGNKLRLIGPNWTLYRSEVGLGRLSSAFHLSTHMLNYILRRRIPGFAERIGFL